MMGERGPMRSREKMELTSHILDETGELIRSIDQDQVRNWAKQYFRRQHDRILQDIKMCASLANPGAKLLDLGCAPFFATISLRRLGYDVVGVDIDPERFAPMPTTAGIDVRKCDIETDRLPFPDHYFDLVLFSEVFEHLRIDLIATVTEVHRVLKPGGYLLCSSPNFLEFRRLFRLLLRQQTSSIYEAYSRLRVTGHMGHVREYTARDVEEFMKRVGFRCERRIYRGMANWRVKPTYFLRALVHRLLPWSRGWFMLVLVKE